MPTNWEEYGKTLAIRTTGEGGNLHWKIGKKNNHIDVHLWALEKISENISKSKTEIDVIIAKESQTEFPDKTLEEMGRALILSKVLGFLYVNGNEYKLSNAYSDLVSQDQKQRISNQLEKFYYFTSIFSKTDRHVDRDARKSPDEYFHIYPIFFIYEVLVILKEKYCFEPVLTKFELECFLFLAQNQSETNQIAERINDFRTSDDKQAIETTLKQKNTMDSRLYSVLKNIIHFNWESSKISIDEPNYEQITSKVSMFNDLKQNNLLIEWTESAETDYFNMLYSKKDFFDYHYSASIKTA